MTKKIVEFRCPNCGQKTSSAERAGAVLGLCADCAAKAESQNAFADGDFDAVEYERAKWWAEQERALREMRNRKR